MRNGKSVILVVEDSPLICMGAVELVSSAGHEPIEAGDADQAIRILEARDDVDLVFTDVQMPGTMDGVDLSHYIRARWPPVKLIIASGAAVLAEIGLPCGSRFFSKPYDDNAIAETIAYLLASDDSREPALRGMGSSAKTCP
jgi:CheY-like chemotaxis protein